LRRKLRENHSHRKEVLFKENIDLFAEENRDFKTGCIHTEEFGISSYSTVRTITERTRNEVAKNRKLRRCIEQLRHELEMSQGQTLSTFGFRQQVKRKGLVAYQ
jgi:glucose-6-phosphate-specific signal transduction histidine kinase